MWGAAAGELGVPPAGLTLPANDDLPELRGGSGGKDLHASKRRRGGAGGGGPPEGRREGRRRLPSNGGRASCKCAFNLMLRYIEGVVLQ
jgi:hypothetical protein